MPVASEKILDQLEGKQHTVVRPLLAEKMFCSSEIFGGTTRNSAYLHHRYWVQLWFTEHSLIPTVFQLLLKGNDSSSTTGTRLDACEC